MPEPPTRSFAAAFGCRCYAPTMSALARSQRYTRPALGTVLVSQMGQLLFTFCSLVVRRSLVTHLLFTCCSCWYCSRHARFIFCSHGVHASFTFSSQLVTCCTHDVRMLVKCWSWFICCLLVGSHRVRFCVHIVHTMSTFCAQLVGKSSRGVSTMIKRRSLVIHTINFVRVLVIHCSWLYFLCSPFVQCLLTFDSLVVYYCLPPRGLLGLLWGGRWVT